MHYARIPYTVETYRRFYDAVIERATHAPDDLNNDAMSMWSRTIRENDSLLIVGAAALSAGLATRMLAFHFLNGSITRMIHGSKPPEGYGSVDDVWGRVGQLAGQIADELESIPPWEGMFQPGLIDLPVIYSLEERIRNDHPLPGASSDSAYWDCQQDLIRTVQRRGLTGPFDYYDTHFDVADDRYNEELYVYLSIHHASAATHALLSDVAIAMRRHLGYATVIGFEDEGWALLHGDKVIVQGELFLNCQGLADVAEAMALAIERLDDAEGEPMW